ncbi:hypothetical protein K0M31_009964 [Melipona bicolor]|uniref:Uncharacterized protein n=1 Tax=Melipona bicolor TaxID=60889 RepID=A0AA40FNJ3_9HYME|nr:hypothetical protein K0M31_009964 [Melipona bicolor]
MRHGEENHTFHPREGRTEFVFGCSPWTLRRMRCHYIGSSRPRASGGPVQLLDSSGVRNTLFTTAKRPADLRIGELLRLCHSVRRMHPTDRCSSGFATPGIDLLAGRSQAIFTPRTTKYSLVCATFASSTRMDRVHAAAAVADSDSSGTAQRIPHWSCCTCDRTLRAPSKLAVVRERTNLVATPLREVNGVRHFPGDDSWHRPPPFCVRGSLLAGSNQRVGAANCRQPNRLEPKNT